MATDTAHPITETLYPVTGMTCGGCAAGIKGKLEALPEVAYAEVDHAAGAARVGTHVPTSAKYLNKAIGEKYSLQEPMQASATAASAPTIPASDHEQRDERSWLETYRPLLIIVGLIALVSGLAAGFDGSVWMRYFMAGFFIVFAGFKLLDVEGFSESYAMYDIIAKRWHAWGYIYPFVELGLGLAYLTNIAPFWTNVITIIVLGISAIGVVQSVLSQRTIKCACLGTGFNLPMSTVTIIEDVGMVLMAALMLALH